MREPDRWRAAWPQVRAGLVALHLVAIGLMALPAPVGGLDRRTWRDPTVQAEFAVWRERLGALGVELTPRAFEDALFQGASGLMAAREVALAPFDPYYRTCGTWQSWRMFVAPHTHPGRLVVEVHDDAGWREVFVERSDEARWLATVFQQDRVRSAIFRYSWPSFKGPYGKFVDWIAGRAAADFPDADRVRVSYRKVATPSPADVRAGNEPEAQVVLSLERDLAGWR